jgi:putative transposase
VCWGVTLEGRKILLGLALGSRESYDSWLAFGRDLIARGMRCPALVVADGAPGIWKAVRELWPEAIEQRCTVHALRNVTSKLPERATTRRSRPAGGRSSTTHAQLGRHAGNCRRL